MLLLSEGRAGRLLAVVGAGHAHVIAHVGRIFSWDEAPSYAGMLPSPNAAVISFLGPDVTVGSWLPWARTALPAQLGHYACWSCLLSLSLGSPSPETGSSLTAPALFPRGARAGSCHMLDSRPVVVVAALLGSSSGDFAGPSVPSSIGTKVHWSREAPVHRRLAPNLPRPLGTKVWVLGSQDSCSLSRLCVSPCQPACSVCVCLWEAMQGTRGRLGPLGRGRRLTRSSRAQSCATSHARHAGSSSPLQYRAGERFKLSACRGKHGSVPYAHRRLLLPCRPAALARPGPTRMYTQEVEDTCKTAGSIGRVEGGQGRVHASSTVAVHPAPRHV